MAEVVTRGDKVKVKVIGITEEKNMKIRLSMKDVDQVTGEDLNPGRKARNEERLDNSDSGRNPDQPIDMNVAGSSSMDTSASSPRRINKMSDLDRWEIQQMEEAGCMPATERPDFDIDSGLIPKG